MSSLNFEWEALQEFLSHIRWLAESANAHLREYEDCEVSRADMLAAFQLIRDRQDCASLALENIRTVLDGLREPVASAQGGDAVETLQ